jgi:hypothetical protein
MAPQAARGDEAAADSKVQVAIRTLEDAVSIFRSHTTRGRAVLKALSALAKEFGPTEELAQKPMAAELKSALMDQSPAAGGGGGGPPPGGAPGGLPPGGPPGGPQPM